MFFDRQVSAAGKLGVTSAVFGLAVAHPDFLAEAVKHYRSAPDGETKSIGVERITKAAAVCYLVSV